MRTSAGSVQSLHMNERASDEFADQNEAFGLSVDRQHAKAAPRKPASRRRALETDDFVKGIESGNRALLGRAITLVESSSPDHHRLAQDVLNRVMPRTGGAVRLGITGVPGVGKSTFIETLGTYLTAQGKRVAVLAVDPSSGRSRGSILGDKTRMAQLATDDNAFIRPSPSGGTLGGVASKTRESMLLCEAAGYDVVLIETVGVGQSETIVADMTDCFLALMLAGAGDELQGIKRGLLELVDIIAINKADGENADNAQRAAREYENALRYMTPMLDAWRPPVLTCSALAKTGIDTLWQTVEQHQDVLKEHGVLDKRRQEQQLRWMWSMIDEQILSRFRNDPFVREQLPKLEAAVREGTIAPTAAAARLIGGAADSRAFPDE